VYGKGVLSHRFRLTLISTSSDMMDYNFLKELGLGSCLSMGKTECRHV